MKREKKIIIPYEEYKEMQESFKIYNELINGNIVFQSQINWSLKFYSKDEGLKRIKEMYDNDVCKFLKESTENFNLKNELRTTEKILKKNIKQKRWLYVICMLAILWSVFVTYTNLKWNG